MSTPDYTASELAERFALTVHGDGSVRVQGVATLATAGNGQLAFLANPRILILDEATTGLDPNQIVEIRNLISEAGKEKTVMLSTHIMQEVEAICSRVIIIDHGRIVADGPIDEISSLAGARLEETFRQLTGR